MCPVSDAILRKYDHPTTAVDSATTLQHVVSVTNDDVLNNREAIINMDEKNPESNTPNPEAGCNDEAGWVSKLPAKKKGAPRRSMYYTMELGYFRQCFQPRFDYPRTCADFCRCGANDFLLVIVGLVNILLFQFLLVVLLHVKHTYEDLGE